MDIMILIIGFLFLHLVILLAINNSRLSRQLKRSNELTKDTNTLLKEIRNLLKENNDRKPSDMKTVGKISMKNFKIVGMKNGNRMCKIIVRGANTYE